MDTIKKKFIIAVVNQENDGRIIINFWVMREIVSENELHAFKESINQLPLVELQSYMVDEGKFPSIPINSLIRPEDFERSTNEVLRLQALVKESQ